MTGGPQPNRVVIAGVLVVVVVIAVFGVWLVRRPGDPEPAYWQVGAAAFDPASSELPIEVVERACASAASADGRIVVDVDETSETITLDVRVRRRSGSQDCPGNPVTPHVVRLDAPIGDREVLGQTPNESWAGLAGAGADDLSRGQTAPLVVDLHCGVGTLDRLIDGGVWRTAEADGDDWVPLPWSLAAEGAGTVIVLASLSDDGRTLRTSLNGRDVVYERVGVAFDDADTCA